MLVDAGEKEVRGLSPRTIISERPMLAALSRGKCRSRPPPSYVLGAASISLQTAPLSCFARSPLLQQRSLPKTSLIVRG